ncbi:MAG: FtsX-like permease family protein [Cyclobacteriaceae bacterium]
MNNFLKPAIRHLLNNKIHALINLFGLSLGLTVSIFIYLFVQDELAYDTFVPGYEQVFRLETDAVTGSKVQTWASTEGYLVPAITALYPDIEAATRMMPINNEVLLKSDTLQFSESKVWAVDTTFFDVFPIPFVYGDAATALDGPEAMVISEALATKFFGAVNPLGKILLTGEHTYRVTGVMQNIPAISHFHANAVVSLKRTWRDVDQSRNILPLYSYVRAKAGKAEILAATLRSDSPKITGFTPTNNPNDVRIEINTVPLAKIHLTSHAEKEIEPNGNEQVVFIFIGAAILILLIASINYINLSNALAIKRAKEIAVRKTIGATRSGLFGKFLLESYLFGLAAFVLSLLTVALLMPWFNTLTGKFLTVRVLTEPSFMAAVAAGWLALGFLSGLYPATLLSSFNPVKALKSGFNERSGKTSLYLRRTFIVFQFAVSAMMIVCTLTIQRQINYIDDLDIGFKKENVVALTLSGDVFRKLDPLKQELERVPDVKAASAMSAMPGKRVVVLTVRIPELAGTQPTSEGEDDGTREMRVMSVDHDVVKALGLKIIEGREFSDVGNADSAHAFIVNEAAVKAFNLKDPVGKPFEYNFGVEVPKKGQIIAVVKDFNFASVHNTVEPLMIHISPWYSVMCVRIESDNTERTLAALESAWGRVTSAPFNYSFLDSTYDALYKADRATGKIVSYFTILAIVIACLGLFGVVSFFARQRVKEVGVRKIFGASTGSLLTHLSKEYVVMVVLGNLLAIYPAWILVERWLQQFAYRIDFEPNVFVFTLCGSAVLALASMLYVIWKVTQSNPAVVLKNE